MDSKEKSRQLGMPFGTANGKLRKNILFHLLKKHGENFCFHCGAEIETADELSIEHKKPWLHENVDLFWDIDNIAFSHLTCNVSSQRNLHPAQFIHGTYNGYGRFRCRCAECTNAHRLYRREERKRKRQTKGL